MVIVEYCRFGNLQNFLVKHRQYFIDQIDREKDVIDPSIQTRDARWSNDSGFSYLNRYATKGQRACMFLLTQFRSLDNTEPLKNHFTRNRKAFAFELI